MHDLKTCLGLDFHQGRRQVGVKHPAEAWIFTGAGAERSHVGPARLKGKEPVSLSAPSLNSLNSDGTTGCVEEDSDDDAAARPRKMSRALAPANAAKGGLASLKNGKATICSTSSSGTPTPKTGKIHPRELADSDTATIGRKHDHTSGRLLKIKPGLGVVEGLTTGTVCGVRGGLHQRRPTYATNPEPTDNSNPSGSRKVEPSLGNAPRKENELQPLDPSKARPCGHSLWPTAQTSAHGCTGLAASGKAESGAGSRLKANWYQQCLPGPASPHDPGAVQRPSKSLPGSRADEQKRTSSAISSLIGSAAAPANAPTAVSRGHDRGKRTAEVPGAPPASNPRTRKHLRSKGSFCLPATSCSTSSRLTALERAEGG